MPHAVTAKEALHDLPPVTLHLEGLLKRGARKFNETAPYRNVTSLSEFAKKMRSWPGFEGNGGVCDHVIRYLPRDYQIFRRMNAGDEYPPAKAHALDLLSERLDALKNNGVSLRALKEAKKSFPSRFALLRLSHCAIIGLLLRAPSIRKNATVFDVDLFGTHSTDFLFQSGLVRVVRVRLSSER